MRDVNPAVTAAAEAISKGLSNSGPNGLAVLGGGATTYTFTHEPFGLYEFEARASLGVRQTEAAACAAATGRLIWDADPLNAAAGYHVYLWSSAAAAPAVTDFVYTTGAVTALPLVWFAPSAK